MVQLAKFKGIRNTVDPQDLEDGELAAATNFDIDDAMGLKSRAGRTLFSDGAADSLFSHRGTALCRRSSALAQLLPDGTTTELQAGVANPIVYAAQGARIFWSDGIVRGVVENNLSGPWGITPPTAQPTYAALASGNLPTGRYLYALTYVRDGLESGTGASAETAEISGGIAFSNIPVPTNVDTKILYLSRPNGNMLYRAAILGRTETTATYLGNTAELGAVLETQFKQPPPAPDVMAEHNGRMLIGVGEFFMWSDPYRADLFDPIRNSFRFASAVRAIAPVEGGVYVGTENSIEYLAGDDIATASRNVKAGYGVVPGTLDYTDAQHMPEVGLQGTCAIIASQKGLCVLGNGGSFKNLTLNRYAYPSAVTGAGVVRLEDGKNRFIVAMRGV